MFFYNTNSVSPVLAVSTESYSLGIQIPAPGEFYVILTSNSETYVLTPLFKGDEAEQTKALISAVTLIKAAITVGAIDTSKITSTCECALKIQRAKDSKPKGEKVNKNIKK
jgi:hypothetical protein